MVYSQLKHVMFDPESRYSRVRAAFVPGEKVYGAFLALSWKAKHPIRPWASDRRSAEMSGQNATLLAAQRTESSKQYGNGEPAPRPVDSQVVPPHPRTGVDDHGDAPVIHVIGIGPTGSKPRDELRTGWTREVVERNLQPEEEDATSAVRPWGVELFSQRHKLCHCRLLILEREARDQLRQVAGQDGGELELYNAMDNLGEPRQAEFARSLAGVPDLDGEFDADGHCVLGAHIPADAPPLPRDTWLVVIVDESTVAFTTPLDPLVSESATQRFEREHHDTIVSYPGVSPSLVMRLADNRTQEEAEAELKRIYRPVVERLASRLGHHSGPSDVYVAQVFADFFARLRQDQSVLRTAPLQEVLFQVAEVVATRQLRQQISADAWSEECKQQEHRWAVGQVIASTDPLTWQAYMMNVESQTYEQIAHRLNKPAGWIAAAVLATQRRIDSIAGQFWSPRGM